LQTILVVGMRLGCLNHALLTQASIREKGINFSGWIANRLVIDFFSVDENQNTLEKCLNAPFLGSIPYMVQTTPVAIPDFLDIEYLL
jgi:dethiobiotin synthetase